jgi:hypothetical protein
MAVIHSLSQGLEDQVSGVGVRTSAIKKFQITNHKYQTNHNDLNSKFQTIGV